MPKKFYEHKIDLLRSARHHLDEALADLEQAVSHEEEHGDPSSIDSELQPLEDGITDMANQVDELIEAVEPLYDMEKKSGG